MALAFVAPRRLEAQERPRIHVIVRFEELGDLRTRVASELAGLARPGEPPPKPEMFLAERARKAFADAIPKVYTFESTPTGTPADTLLVTLTWGGAMRRAWPKEQVDLRLCLAKPEPQPTCRAHQVRIGKVLEADERRRDRLIDDDFVGGPIKEWSMGKSEEEIFKLLRVPIPTVVRVTADGKIETPLAYDALGLRRREAIFAVDAEEYLVEFRACLHTIGGRMTTKPCHASAPRPSTAPPPGRLFSEVYYLRSEP